MSLTSDRDTLADTPDPVAGPAGARELVFDIAGMSCASCAARIERRLGRLDGVSARVNLATDTALITVGRRGGPGDGGGGDRAPRLQRPAAGRAAAPSTAEPGAAERARGWPQRLESGGGPGGRAVAAAGGGAGVRGAAGGRVDDLRVGSAVALRWLAAAAAGPDGAGADLQRGRVLPRRARRGPRPDQLDGHPDHPGGPRRDRLVALRHDRDPGAGRRGGVGGAVGAERVAVSRRGRRGGLLRPGRAAVGGRRPAARRAARCAPWPRAPPATRPASTTPAASSGSRRPSCRSPTGSWCAPASSSPPTAP